MNGRKFAAKVRGQSSRPGFGGQRAHARHPRVSRTPICTRARVARTATRRHRLTGDAGDEDVVTCERRDALAVGRAMQAAARHHVAAPAEARGPIECRAPWDRRAALPRRRGRRRGAECQEQRGGERRPPAAGRGRHGFIWYARLGRGRACSEVAQRGPSGSSVGRTMDRRLRICVCTCRWIRRRRASEARRAPQPPPNRAKRAAAALVGRCCRAQGLSWTSAGAKGIPHAL